MTKHHETVSGDKCMQKGDVPRKKNNIKTTKRFKHFQTCLKPYTNTQLELNTPSLCVPWSLPRTMSSIELLFALPLTAPFRCFRCFRFRLRGTLIWPPEWPAMPRQGDQPLYDTLSGAGKGPCRSYRFGRLAGEMRWRAINIHKPSKLRMLRKTWNELKAHESV